MGKSRDLQPHTKTLQTLTYITDAKKQRNELQKRCHSTTWTTHRKWWQHGEERWHGEEGQVKHSSLWDYVQWTILGVSSVRQPALQVNSCHEHQWCSQCLSAKTISQFSIIWKPNSAFPDFWAWSDHSLSCIQICLISSLSHVYWPCHKQMSLTEGTRANRLNATQTNNRISANIFRQITLA